MGEPERQKEMYTRWFNVDHPWTVPQNSRYGNGDYETVENIKHFFKTICSDMYEIVGAECRVLGREGAVFTEDKPLDTGDVLYLPCTNEGVVCRAEDQGPGQMCEDYSVRFRCTYTGKRPEEDDRNLFPEFDARIYLVLAIVPVIIFCIRLLWAYVFRRRRRQRRRQRREQRRLRGEARDGEEDEEDDEDGRSINSDLARPPPSYQELFTNGTSPAVFTISGGSLTACPKCKDAQCSVVKEMRGLGNVEGNNNADVQSSVQAPPPSLPTPPPTPERSHTSTQSTAGESEENQSRLSSGNGDNNSPNGQCVEDVPLENLSSSEAPPSNVSVENETGEGEESPAAQADSDQMNEQTSTDTSTDTTTVTLSISTDSTSETSGIPADVPSPCACACHRANPLSGRGLAGYDNPSFTSDLEMASPSDGRREYRGRHISPLPRPVSSVSMVSQITLSELPSYEDALELEKKMAAEIKNTQT